MHMRLFGIISAAALVVFSPADAAKVTPTIISTPNVNYSCVPDSNNTLPTWSYARVDITVSGCTEKYIEARATDTSVWTMLNAYRAGGDENVHWKFTKDKNDPECLENWMYFEGDGHTPIAKVEGRITRHSVREPYKHMKWWCPLAVYRPGGIFGKQYTSCSCKPAEPDLDVSQLIAKLIDKLLNRTSVRA